MSDVSELLLEGSYLFYEKDVNYSQENFKFFHLVDLQQYHLVAEILTRVDSGEFLKILVRYEMNKHFTPVSVRIEKSMGNRFALEQYKIDTTEQELFYHFEGSETKHDEHRPLNAKHYITTPAFSTTSFFTIHKKFDQTGRTPLIFLSSPNDWEYEAPLVEKIVYGEFKRDTTEFKIKDKPLDAHHLCLFEHSSHDITSEEPVDLYISKYHGLPYELVQGDKKIIVKNLKKNY